MNGRFKKSFPALLLTLMLASPLVFAQSEAKKEASKEPSRNFMMAFPGGRNGCLPAEVIGVSMATAPVEAFEFTFKNYHWKIIEAVKFGWYVVEDEKKAVWSNILRNHVRCDAPPTKDKIILSGQTALIQVGPLHPQATCTVGKDPMLVGPPAGAKKVLTDFPLLKMDDVKDLTIDGTWKTYKKQYSMLIAVSEIHFADGTIWKVDGVPPPLSLDPK